MRKKTDFQRKTPSEEFGKPPRFDGVAVIRKPKNFPASGRHRQRYRAGLAHSITRRGPVRVGIAPGSTADIAARLIGHMKEAAN
jgi:hypothetical protein